MGEVVDLSERYPHFCIVGPLGEPHVVPVCLIQKMAFGTNPLILEGQEEIDTDMIRGILADWLDIQGFWDGYETRVEVGTIEECDE